MDRPGFGVAALDRTRKSGLAIGENSFVIAAAFEILAAIRLSVVAHDRYVQFASK